MDEITAKFQHQASILSKTTNNNETISAGLTRGAVGSHMPRSTSMGALGGFTSMRHKVEGKPMEKEVSMSLQCFLENIGDENVDDEDSDGDGVFF